nr:hypothetical protein Iba_chr10cCG6490 [Ipomoea batatas]
MHPVLPEDFQDKEQDHNIDTLIGYDRPLDSSDQSEVAAESRRRLLLSPSFSPSRQMVKILKRQAPKVAAECHCRGEAEEDRCTPVAVDERRETPPLPEATGTRNSP